MKNESLVSFLDKLGSKRPTPGGGAVAGLNGAIACSQLCMVYEYSGLSPSKIKLYSKQFLKLADEDMKLYKKLSVAYKDGDSSFVQKSLVKASQPAAKMLALADKVLDEIKQSLDKQKKNILSDSIVAVANLKASVRSAQAIISVNAKYVSDEKTKDELKKEVVFATQLLAKADNSYNEIWTKSNE